MAYRDRTVSEILDSPIRRGSRRYAGSEITSASYMLNDEENRPLYSLIDLSSKVQTRDFDYAPTNLSSEIADASDAIGRDILSMYGQSGQGNEVDLATRMAIDTTIAGAFGLDYRDVARNHKYYVNLFAGEDVEDRGFGEALAKAWERESVEQDIARLQNRFDYTYDDDERRRLLEEIEGLELRSLQLGDYSNRGWLGNGLVNTMPIIRQIGRSLIYTAAGAVIGAGVGGLFSGTATAAGATGNFLKGLTMLSSAAKTGATVGRVADAVYNTFARERGSLSRQLYLTVDENGNRIDDTARTWASSIYGILSSMVEYLLPEPGLEKIVPNGLSLFIKKDMADLITNQSKRFGARVLLGAVSESTEEGLQQLLSDIAESTAKAVSNQFGVTDFKGRPIGDAIWDYLNNAFGAFSEAFLPSLIAGLPGTVISSGTEAYINVSQNGKLRSASQDEKASAKQFQRYDVTASVVPSDLIRFKRNKPSASFMESITERAEDGAEGKVQTSDLPTVEVRKGKNGYLEPIDDYNADLAKYLYNSGAKGISVHIHSDDVILDSEGISAVASLHNGFYDGNTNAIYVATEAERDSIIGDLGEAIIRTETSDEGIQRIIYRDAEGEEASFDVVVDPTLSDVLSGTEEDRVGAENDVPVEATASEEPASQEEPIAVAEPVEPSASPAVDETPVASVPAEEEVPSAVGADQNPQPTTVIENPQPEQPVQTTAPRRRKPRASKASPLKSLSRLPEELRTKLEGFSSRKFSDISSRASFDEVKGILRENPKYTQSILERYLSALFHAYYPAQDQVNLDYLAKMNALSIMYFADISGMSVPEYLAPLLSFDKLPNRNGRRITVGQLVMSTRDNVFWLKMRTGMFSPTTFAHEMAHFFLYNLPDGDVKNQIIEAFREDYEKDGGKIGFHVQEAFAYGLEAYIQEGMSNVPAMRKIFDKIVSLMKDILVHGIYYRQLNDEQIAMYDRFFGEDLEAIVRRNEARLRQEQESAEGHGFFSFETNDSIVETGAGNDSSTALREGYIDRGRDDLGSDRGTSRDAEQSHAGSGLAEGLSDDPRFSQGNDIRTDRDGIHLESVLRKEKDSFRYIPIRQISNTEAQKFHDALANVQKTNPKGLYVSLYSVEEYSDPSIKLFMSEDGAVGFAIKSDGDIVSVFSDKTKANHPGAVYSILLTAIENGGRKLDCYGYDLLKVYMRMGFVPQGKVAYDDSYESAEWTKRKDVLGSPDVFALYYGDQSIDQTIALLEARFNAISNTSINDAVAALHEYTDTDEGAGYDRLMSARDESLRNHIQAFNEDVDLDSDEAYRAALRERIRRGRAAQAQRRRRFFENIDAMLDKGLYVDTDDLMSYRRAIESEIDERNNKSGNDRRIKYSEDPRWNRIKEEMIARDRMLLYPGSYVDVARRMSITEFESYVKDHSGTSEWTGEDSSIARRYYNYVNTPQPRVQLQAFVDEYSSLPRLLSLKTILGPRRVASKSRSGNVFTRLYVPTSNVYQEIRDLNANSSQEEVRAVLDSIRLNTVEWYQAYLNALISGSKIGRRSVEDTDLDLEAIAISYYAGKKFDPSNVPFFEKLTSKRRTSSSIDISKAQDAISPSTPEGRAARNIRRGDTFSDEYIRKIVPKTTAEIELEKERARARESIARSERAIKRMTNFSRTDTDARYLPVAQWIYMFMHGGRTGLLAEILGSSADSYQDILEGVESSGAEYVFYPNIQPDAEGSISIVSRYDEIENVEGFEANLGGARFSQQEIPSELAKYLSEETIQHIKEAEGWNQLTAQDIADIASALRMAKQWAQDIQQAKNQERLSKARNKSRSVASRLLKVNMKFTNDQLFGIGHNDLKLGRAATPEEAMDFYRRNPARIFEDYDSRRATTEGERTRKNLKEMLTEGYLGFIKIQRFTRMLDGEENGPIFNAFVRDIFDSYQNMQREVNRRTKEAEERFAPIIGNPDDPSLNSAQRAKEKEKRRKFLAMMNEIHTLAASSNYEGERTTRELSGFDLLQMYLNSKNINGFKKLIDPNRGSGIAIEALMKYAPAEVAEFIELELKVREALVSDRNRINANWNAAELNKYNADPANYVPEYRNANLTWEQLTSEQQRGSFIPGTTQHLQSLLETAKNTESILNDKIRNLGDSMLALLSKETDRLVEADYQQRNELMRIERNYWPLLNSNRSIEHSLNLMTDEGASRISPFTGMLKTRNSQAMYDVIGLNPFAIFYSAIDAQERFINMGSALRDVDNMWDLHGGNIGEIVGIKLGKNVSQYLKKYLQRMAGKEAFNSTMGLEFLNGLLPRLQASYIGLSPLTVVRQYVSLIHTSARGETSRGAILSALYKYATDSVYRETVAELIRTKAPEIANTDISQEIGWQRRMEKMQFRNDEAKNRIRDFFTSWIRFHDKVTKEIAWMAVYETAKAKGTAEGDAVFKASNAVQETMSVSDPISRSQLQENRSAIVRLLFMFTTDIFNTWNILFGDAVNDWKEGDKMRAVKRMAGFLGATAALALIQGGWLPDEDDDDDDLLFNFFDLNGFLSDFGGEFVTGIPTIGPFLADAYRGFGSSIPVVSDTWRNFRNMTKEDATIGKRIDSLIDEALVLSGAFLGTPTSTGRRGINVFYTPEGGFAFNPLAFLNGDYEDFGRRIFE